MPNIERRRWLAAGAALAVPGALRAQPATYPSKPIRLILPEAPGGLPSVLARMIADPLSRRLGQPIVVDNRAGAGGIIGTKLLLQEPADGHTLLFTHIGNQVISALVQKTPPYHPLDDFTPVALCVVNTGGFLVVRTGLPIHTPQELLAYARANPGKLTFASTGVGSIMHLAVEMLKKQSGTNILHVPFQGPVAAMNGLAAGDVDLTIAGSLALALPMVQAGKVRLLARVGTKRAPDFPDIPTLTEAAVPGFVLPFWLGFTGRAGLPAEVVGRLNREINAITASDTALQAQLVQSYLESVQGPPGLMRDTIARDFETFGKVVRENNITAAG